MNRLSKIKFLSMTIIGCLIFASTLRGQTVPSPTLTSICATYTNAVAKIATDVAISNDAALSWYGENLEDILATCRKNSDSDGFSIVKQEAKRFKAERMVPTNNVPALVALAVLEYQGKIITIDVESARRKVYLLERYIVALNRLSIELMEKGKEKDVEIVKRTRIEAEALLAQLRSGKPLSDQPVVKEPPASSTPSISVNPSVPVFPTNTVVTLPPEKPIVPTQPKVPEKVVSSESPTNSVAPKQEVPSVVGTGDVFVFKGHRYKFVDQARITYPQSVEACQAIGGHLVTINTPLEWEWIKKTFLKGDSEKSFRSIYLGVEMPAKGWWSDAKTKWVDGDRFDMKGADWAEGHPWPHKEAEGFRFRWIMNFGGKWASIGATDDRINGFICEWDSAAVPTKLGGLSAKEMVKQDTPVASSADGTRFVVECNGSKVTNALIVVYAGGGTGYPFMTWGRQVIECGITQADGVKLHIPPGKYKYQVNVFASGYQFYSGKDEEIRGDKFVIKVRKQANTHGADRWIYLPRGTGAPVFSNSKDPEIEVVFMSHTCPPQVKTVNSSISFHHGIKQVTTYKTFDVYKGDVEKNPQVATCQPIWYFGLDGRDCPSGLVVLVNEK